MWEDEVSAYTLVLVEQIGPPMHMEEDGMERVSWKSPSGKESNNLFLSEGDRESSKQSAYSCLDFLAYSEE